MERRRSARIATAPEAPRSAAVQRTPRGGRKRGGPKTKGNNRKKKATPAKRKPRTKAVAKVATVSAPPRVKEKRKRRSTTPKRGVPRITATAGKKKKKRTRANLTGAVKRRFFRRQGATRISPSALPHLDTMANNLVAEIMQLSMRLAVKDNVSTIKSRHVRRALAIMRKPVY